MSIGQMVKRAVGPRLTRKLEAVYISLFFNRDEIIAGIPRLPEGAHVLDVGSGDGDLIGAILRLNPTATADLVDTAPVVGQYITDDLRPRVNCYANTTLKAYKDLNRPAPQVVLLSYVLHHIEPSERERVLADVQALHPEKVIVIECSPGTLRGKMAFMADRYISGTPVWPLRPEELINLVKPSLAASQTERLQIDNFPTYGFAFS
jgi:hypothetical protein